MAVTATTVFVLAAVATTLGRKRRGIVFGTRPEPPVTSPFRPSDRWYGPMPDG